MLLAFLLMGAAAFLLLISPGLTVLYPAFPPPGTFFLVSKTPRTDRGNTGCKRAGAHSPKGAPGLCHRPTVTLHIFIFLLPEMIAQLWFDLKEELATQTRRSSLDPVPSHPGKTWLLSQVAKGPWGLTPRPPVCSKGGVGGRSA